MKNSPPTYHRKGCQGNCEYCKYCRKEQKILDDEKEKNMSKLAWDEVSVMI